MHDIQSWLINLDLEKYVSIFTDAEIDFETLPDLEEEDLKELGLPIGPRRKIWTAIKCLDATPSLLAKGSENPIPSDPVPLPISDVAPTSDAERRHMTVMFVDLVGSTEMANRIDPEDMRNVITSYQNTVAGVVAFM